MITISTYTGNWAAVLHRDAPDCGTTVCVRHTADARETRDFIETLNRHGRALLDMEVTTSIGGVFEVAPAFGYV